METYDLEIKVRLCNNLHDWLDIPVTFVADGLTEAKKKKLLSNLKAWCNTTFVSGIRWNYKGSLNGNYYSNQLSKDNKSYLNEEK